MCFGRIPSTFLLLNQGTVPRLIDVQYYPIAVLLCDQRTFLRSTRKPIKPLFPMHPGGRLPSRNIGFCMALDDKKPAQIALKGNTQSRSRASTTSRADITTPPSAASSTPTATQAPVRASSGTMCLLTVRITHRRCAIQLVTLQFGGIYLGTQGTVLCDGMSQLIDT